MKSPKTLLIATLAAGALLASTGALLAQNAPDAPPAGEKAPGVKSRQNMAQALNLTDEQKPKVQEIMKKAMEKRKELRADTSLTPEEKKAKNKEIQENIAKELKVVLTPEQYAKWEESTKRGPHQPPTTHKVPPSAPAAASKN